MERPSTSSKGPVAIVGGTPPSRGLVGSRAGTSGTPLGTAQRQGTALGAALEALTNQLIKRMRMRFADAAQDVQSQEIIAQEVIAFMRTNTRGRVQEEDIGVLQEKIRQRLTGSTPMKNTLATQKRAQMEHDEWAKIFEFHIAAGLSKDRAEQELARKRQQDMRVVLERQMAEREHQKKLEHDDEIRYAAREQEDLRRWQSEEERKAALHVEIMNRLKEDRQAQLVERQRRRDNALAKVRTEEQRMASKIAYETRAEFEKEEQERIVAKQALKEFLLSNEVNKALKEEAKRKQWEEDAAFQKKWEAQLDKQEKERLDRLERLKKIQNQQAEIAKSRPEAKRWLDQAIVDRYYKEREDARAAEEDRRVAKLRETAKRCVTNLDEQMAERERLKAEQKRRDEEHARWLAEKVRRDEEAEAARRAAELQKKLKFRAELDAQLKENAVRRIVAPMTSIEKRINTGLLHKVHEWERTGKSLSSSLDLLAAST